MIKKLDLRGLVCPEPVLNAKKALDDPAVDRVEALVDDDVCVNNLNRLARSVRAYVSAIEQDGYYQVVIERSTGAAAEAAPAAAEAKVVSMSRAAGQGVGTIIFLSRDSFGDGDPEFSRTLVNLFLQTALEAGHEPRAILMANSGVKLMSPDSPSLKVLNDFKERGCEVLACGLCVEYYGLKGMIPTEQITNMYAICEYLFAADKVLTP